MIKAAFSGIHQRFLNGMPFSRSATIVFAMVACLGQPASANLTTFDLSNVAFNGGSITAAGSFAYDSSTNTIRAIDVLLSGPATGYFNFFASGPVAFDTETFDYNSPFELGLTTQNGQGDMNLFAVSPLNSSNPTADALLSGNSGLVSALEINGTPLNDIETLVPGGSLVPETATPEPGTFGILVCSLGLLLWRRRAV